jgi:hypothetical protein
LEHRPVLCFLVLAFALSIAFWLLGSLFEIQLRPGLPIGALAAFTPAIAAVIMVYRDGRLSAVQNLLRRSLDAARIRDRRWYFVFVLYGGASYLFYVLTEVCFHICRTDRLGRWG